MRENTGRKGQRLKTPLPPGLLAPVASPTEDLLVTFPPQLDVVDVVAQLQQGPTLGRLIPCWIQNALVTGGSPNSLQVLIKARLGLFPFRVGTPQVGIPAPAFINCDPGHLTGRMDARFLHP